MTSLLCISVPVAACVIIKAWVEQSQGGGARGKRWRLGPGTTIGKDQRRMRTGCGASLPEHGQCQWPGSGRGASALVLLTLQMGQRGLQVCHPPEKGSCRDLEVLFPWLVETGDHICTEVRRGLLYPTGGGTCVRRQGQLTPPAIAQNGSEAICAHPSSLKSSAGEPGE